jgi:WhiB family transcriptional regulator, redox-sensing transcriptional regulator
MYLPGTAAVIDDAVIDETVATEADVMRVTAISQATPAAIEVRQMAAPVVAVRQVAPATIVTGAEFPCADDPDLFFAESPDDVELAKSLCGGCQFRVSCLAGAIERREPWGVWGGELFLRGEIVPRKRARGRPRKNEVAA